MKTARFLSEKRLAGAPTNKTIIIGGGFEEKDTVKCSRPNIAIRVLKSFHKEADTCMILHCVHSDAEFLVISCQDSDVFLLLVSQFYKLSCKKLWMRAGASEKPKYLPIHIREHLKKTIPEVQTILSFHAITGCDTVSYFASHSKKTSWKTFTENHVLLRNL